jgi:hypothetical protein
LLREWRNEVLVSLLFASSTVSGTAREHRSTGGQADNSPVTVYFKSSSKRLYTMLGCSNLAEGGWANVPGGWTARGGRW